MTTTDVDPLPNAKTARSVVSSDVKSSFVLVHGGWHGGWCWRRVAEILRAEGHTVYTPTLTGLADRSHLLTPDVGLHTHVVDIVNLLEWEELDQVVLCGHSYGGAVITGVAEAAEQRLAAIVYLDAFIPESGQALIDIASAESQIRLREALARGNVVPPIPALVFNVNAADRAWVDSLCTPQPGASFTDALPNVAAFERIAGKHYIRALDYPSIPFDRYAAARDERPDWTVTRLPGGHDLMLDAPRELAHLLMAAAR